MTDEICTKKDIAKKLEVLVVSRTSSDLSCRFQADFHDVVENLLVLATKNKGT